LRIPKAFLNFEEVTGEGKNLALQDIRFSRTINRIQQSMIQELNKIAIIHLYVLGLEDELENFTLSLNNPSTQADMLLTEQLQLKMTLFKEAVSDAGNGFAAYSMTRAKRDILGMSEEEIRNDYEQQRLEKAASAELEQTSTIIKKTGIFDRVDTLYGEFGTTPDEAAAGGEAGEDTGMGSDIGGSPMGGGDFGADLESAAATEAGAEVGGEIAAAETPVESTNKKGDLLTENNKNNLEKKTKKYKDIYLKKLLESIDNDKTAYDLDVVDEGADKLNSNISRMAAEIDEMIK